MNGEQEQAIGFLLPHSFENLNLASTMYDKLEIDEVFWVFTAKIDLIESVSGIKFPGISGELKSSWGNSWFASKRGTGRNIRSNELCGRGSPSGVIADSTREQRLKACLDPLKQ